MQRTTPALLAVLLALATSLAGPAQPAYAQAHMPGHGGMRHGADAAPPQPATTATASAGQGDGQEMMAAMERMNRDMMAPQAMTGDPDRDLVAMMIPHHQGAIDMARIYLRTGRDPQIRRMARKIVADQEREIRELRAWQAKHPAPAR